MVGLHKIVDNYRVATFVYLHKDSGKERISPQQFLLDVFCGDVIGDSFVTTIINPKNTQEMYHYGQIKHHRRTFNCVAQSILKDNIETLILIYSTREEAQNREKAFELFPLIHKSTSLDVLQSAVKIEGLSLPKENKERLKKALIEVKLKGTFKDSTGTPVKDNQVGKYIYSH